MLLRQAEAGPGERKLKRSGSVTWVWSALTGVVLACGGATGTGLRVAMTVHPGKPGAPVERVEVRREDGLCRISSVRTSPDGDVLAAGEGHLEAAACDALWRDIDRIQLERFSPRERPEPVDDYGSVSVALEWREGSDVREKTWTWERPLVDPAPADALASALARSARTAIAEVPLAYFPDD